MFPRRIRFACRDGFTTLQAGDCVYVGPGGMLWFTREVSGYRLMLHIDDNPPVEHLIVPELAEPEEYSRLLELLAAALGLRLQGLLGPMSRSGFQLVLHD